MSASVKRITVPSNGVVGLFDAADVTVALNEIHIQSTNFAPLRVVDGPSDTEVKFPLSARSSFTVSEEIYVLNVSDAETIVDVLFLPKSP
jgi:hypothetical protein